MNNTVPVVCSLVVSTTVGLLAVAVPSTKLRAYRPAPPTPSTREHTVLIPLGRVTKLRGSSATLVADDGRVFDITAIPLGRYRDIQIRNNVVVSATQIGEASLEECRAIQEWTIVPPQKDDPLCRTLK